MTRRSRMDWLTAATVHGAAALTTIGFVVASVVDAILDAVAPVDASVRKNRSVTLKRRERQRLPGALPEPQRRYP